NGNACTISFGKDNMLNIGSASISFDGSASPEWSDLTLHGAVTSSSVNGTIVMTGNVMISSYANITNTANGGSAVVNNSAGTVSILGGTLSGGTNGNAVISIDAGASVLLGRDPTIIGNIHAAPGTLSVITSGDDAFVSSDKTYSVFISGTLSEDLVSVIDGEAFADKFISANSSWILEPKDNDLVLTFDPAYWFTVTFDPNNGEDTWSELILLSHVPTLTKPEGIWKKDGYISGGKWFFSDGTEFVFGTSLVSENTKLYLNWNAAAVVISTTTVADGELGKQYSSAITASLEGGAAGTITYELVSGDLPPGLVFDGSSGTISGIPKDIGEYTFTVRAVSVITNEETEKTFTMEIYGDRYYYWSSDSGNKFLSLADAMTSGGSGILIVTGSFVDDLGAADPIVFDGSVILSFEEGAELTLKDGHVTIGGVDLTGGKLILDNTVLTILGDLIGSGDVELVDDSDLIVDGNVNIDGNITGSGNLDVDGNVNIGGNLDIDGNVNVDGDAKIGGDLDVSGNADIGGDLDVSGNVNVGGDLSVGGDLEIGGDLTINGKTISVTGIEETYSYTGSQIIPDIAVIYDGEILTEGADYVITCSDNINAGKAKVTIEFIGEYEHILTVTKSFSIVYEEEDESSSSPFLAIAVIVGLPALIYGIAVRLG
ncbi:MAG: putative Ig domain-containing protein, partial [Methanomassiliicoccaceae archaeon]|nr:putative Ig domain-containing protein [Methanomassiliicoccaceae archaeon]